MKAWKASSSGVVLKARKASSSGVVWDEGTEGVIIWSVQGMEGVINLE